jgi:hypothetical protein
VTSEPTTAERLIPADAIKAIRTLPHIAVDRMLGLWVSLDQVIGLLDSWTETRPVDAALAAEKARVARLRALVDEQAEDEGLWFIARTAPEGYLQQELRRLHAAIEAETADTPAEPQPQTIAERLDDVIAGAEF